MSAPKYLYCNNTRHIKHYKWVRKYGNHSNLFPPLRGGPNCFHWKKVKLFTSKLPLSISKVCEFVRFSFGWLPNCKYRSSAGEYFRLLREQCVFFWDVFNIKNGMFPSSPHYSLAQLLLIVILAWNFRFGRFISLWKKMSEIEDSWYEMTLCIFEISKI